MANTEKMVKASEVREHILKLIAFYGAADGASLASALGTIAGELQGMEISLKYGTVAVPGVEERLAAAQRAWR